MFTTPLDLRADKPGSWVLLSPLIWKSHVSYIVPAGTTTDLASIPKIFRNILERNGRSRRPSVLHDFLYQTQLIPRSDADTLFLDALKAEGVGASRYLYYNAVRLGGWIAWRSK